jgi:alpha-ketoglutarate-dependent taurine dioxygenase
MTHEFFFQGTGNLPLVIESTDNDDLPSWLSENRQSIESKLIVYGAILFRGFHAPDIDTFEKAVVAFGHPPLDYNFRSTQRKEMKHNIYTSTEYPPDQEIAMHNENSYKKQWPMKLWFYCACAAEVGGETPLVDSRKMYEKLDRAVLQKFVSRQLTYVRNYIPNFDLSWQNVFQTNSPAEMEKFCRENGLQFEWVNNNHLRTRHIAQSAAKHPVTAENVWFNQAHLFHYSNLNKDIADRLLAAFGEENLPRNAYFADSESIPVSDLIHIRDVYRQLKSVFKWKTGDLLLMDNMMVAHGRHPFKGDRKILVAMTEPTQ